MYPFISIPKHYKHTVKFAKSTSGTVNERIDEVADYILSHRDPVGYIERYTLGLNNKEKIILSLQRFLFCDEKNRPRRNGNFNPLARSIAYEGVKKATKRISNLYVNNDS